MKRRIALLVALVLILSTAWAQDKDKASPEPAAKGTKENPKSAVKPDSKSEGPAQETEVKKEARRDPTAARLRRRLLPATGVPNRVSATRIPSIKLRGRVLRKGREPAAVIEVEGRIIVARKNSEITLNNSSAVLTPLNPPGGRGEAQAQAVQNLVLRVIKIDAEDVQFQVLATQQRLVIR